MLYLTTREKHNPQTVSWTLKESTAQDGGLYVPFKMPVISPEEMKDLTFGQTVAQVLNLFFSTELTGWDVELCMGRNPVKLVNLGRNVCVAECWRNLDGSYHKMERNLAARICGCGAMDVKLTSWLRIALRIAVLAGIFGELRRNGIDTNVDIAVSTGDFNLPMAVWYCRRMGMNIGNIICGCRANDGVWDLLHMGEMRTSSGVPAELERLIHGTFGVEEALRYSHLCENGDVYSLLPPMAERLRSGMFAAVISPERTASAIPNVYSTSGYIMNPETAVAYSSLMDYRARSGGRTAALLLSDTNPADDAADVAAAMKISREKLKELLG